MKRFVQGVRRLALVGLLLAVMSAGMAPLAVASGPPDITCNQTGITDPDTGVVTLVTVITVTHEGQVVAEFLVRGWIDCPGPGK